MDRHCDKCNLEVPRGTVLSTLCVDGAAHHLVDNVSAPAVQRAPVPTASDKESNKLLIEFLKKQETTMSAVKKTMEKQMEVLGGIGEVLGEIGDKDCYDRISESSKPRELSKLDYELAYGVPAADLKCMITGIHFTALNPAPPTSPKPKNPVTLSHLLARNAEAKERLSLGYRKADIENIRNSILLCKGIEEAFDHKFISFVPTDKPFSNNRYKLHIWVDACKTDLIYEGATLTIGSFDGTALDLTVGTIPHNPFKRALSYQAFRAFKTWDKMFGLTELLEDSDTSVYQGAYKQRRAVYAQQLAKDAALDAEDDEEQDEAVDEESGGEDF
ncbi:hypothetical protein B484DRAFT_432695 [Ochromonadaceae sp. CCMP2298]|nr:hypothetical protein B484DRAFT_432695 [Ochromonadaceae sp. CCMP2298]